MGLLPVAIATATEDVRTELTVIVMPELVPNVELAQGALELKTQVITSPLDNVFIVKVGLFPPVFIPFNFHW